MKQSMIVPERYLPFIALVAVLILLSRGGATWGSGIMGFGMMGGGMWLFWIAIAVGLYFIFSWIPVYGGGGQRRTLRIAEERYARGEITIEELDEIRDNLGRDWGID